MAVINTKIPELHSIWRHDNGNEYCVIGIANQHHRDSRHPIIIIYEGLLNRHTWARGLSSWHDTMTEIKQAKEKESDKT